jgi:hypothetical protein
MHYQEVVDEVMGPFYLHRTLRTLFDCKSSEWKDTALQEKSEILKALLDNGKMTLDQILDSYRFYYSIELAGKRYVVDNLEASLEMIQEWEKEQEVENS